MSRTFPAKLLLFGEYTVLNGSQALAVPLDRWKGEWQKAKSSGSDDAFIRSYLHWLRQHHYITTDQEDIILQEYRDGWRYHSDIPIGYGLGSSGAFVAALYDRYIHTAEHMHEKDVQAILAGMEGYFHGSSSGLDPMVAYTQQGVFKDDLGIYHCLKDPGWPDGYQVFLLDSGMDRATGPLVHQFKEKIMHEHFRMVVERQLIPMVDHAIHFYLSGTGQMLGECLACISEFQREHFSFLIPDPIKEYWDKLVSTRGVYVKLCGAGGGGYFLVAGTNHEASLWLSGISDLIAVA